MNDLMLFLSRHKKTDGGACTHTGMYIPLKGSWNVDDESINEFWEIYTNIYENFCVRQSSRLGIGITEVMGECSPVLIDLDMKTSLADGTGRRYTMSDIQLIVEKYQQTIIKYVTVDDTALLTASVFEKPSPRILNETTLKDGVHIIFNDVVVNKRVHRRIHEDVSRYIKINDMFGHLSKGDLIDSCSVTNNWMIYGSVKREDPSGYILTKEIDADGKVNEATMVTEPRKYSIRRDASDLLDLADAGIQVMSNLTKEPVEVVSDEPMMDDEDQHVRYLLSLLGHHRADDEPQWIRVGWCLRNINVNLLPLWIEWSKTSSKYADGECDSRWKRFRDTGYNLSSLSFWAKMDSPDAYEEYLQKRCASIIEYSISCGAHYDIARILYCKYQDVFKSTNPKKSDEWYYFDRHRWREMPGGYILMNKISSDLGTEFQSMANRYRKNMINCDAKIVSELTEKRTKCSKLAYNVKDNGFKTGVLKECARMFFDEKFDKSLDANPLLIGFENGVYDISQLQFREGMPDDYVSKSTNIHYAELSEDDKHVKAVHAFLEKVQPDKDLRQYLLSVLSTFLNGETEEQTFQIWTGSGSNGKSTIIELFERTFGDDYCGKFPVTLLTRDRSNSNACTPELQDVSKKRFASMQEPNDNDVIYTGAMKEYTGGDKIYSRGLFAKPSPFKPQFKLVLLCNKMPNIKGWDYGTWRRIRVLNFTSSFVDNPRHKNEYQKDKTLCKSFDDWREAFMWILVKNLETYMRKGMSYPSAVLTASKDYQKKNDVYASFMDDNYTITGNDDDKILVNDMYQSFRSWWKGIGNSGSIPNKTEFMDYISNNTKLKQQNNNRYLYGVSVANTAEINNAPYDDL